MNGTQQTENVLWLFGRVFMAPFAVFVYGVEAFFKVVQEAQRAANQGIETLISAQNGWNRVPEVSAEQAVSADLGTSSTSGNISDFQVISKEDQTLDNANCCNDTNLHDDLLKLVRYKILFVKREYEHAFPEQEELVYDNMDGNAFTAWKVAQFIQEVERGDIPLPRRWEDRNYKKEHWKERDGRKWLSGLPHEDKKYLRVYYQVLDRYPREKFRYEEQQIEVLKEIRDCICREERRERA